MSDADDFLRAVGRPAPQSSTFAPAAPGPKTGAGMSFEANPAPAGRESIVKFWMGQGAPQYVAEGIADRVGVESGFRPDIIGDSGTSGGQYQHHADRLQRLKTFAAKRGRPWNDPEVQNEFAASEVRGGDPIAAEHWKEILAAPNRQTAAYLWDRYFERSKGGADTPWSGHVTAAGPWRVSDDAVTRAERSGRAVYWADPLDMLALLPPVEDTKQENRKGERLRKSIVVNGEPIEALPEIRGTVKDGRYEISDYDGRHRLQEAAKAGVDLVPVAFELPKGADPRQIAGMTGVVAPFDFRRVSRSAPEQFSESTRAQYAPAREGEDSGLGHIMAAVAAGAREGFGSQPLGLSDKTAQDMRDLGLFNKPGGPQYPLGSLYEGAARAVAAPLDAVSRGVSAVMGGVGAGVGAVAGELGMDPGMAQRLGRDITGLGNTAATLSAAAPVPIGMRTGAPGFVERAADRFDARAAAAGERSALAAGMTPERAALAQEGMDRFGLPLTATGKGAIPAIQNQRAFNREVAKTFGENAEALTSEVMDRARKRIGGVMNQVESRNALEVDDDLINDLAHIESAARDALVDSEYLVIKRQMNNILGRVRRGDFMPGRSYGNLLHRNAALDVALRSGNPNISAVAGEVRTALQDALQRSISGEDLAAYRETRRQYRNLKTVEPIASNDPLGNIDPVKLNSRRSTRDKRRAYDTSDDALNRLGKIGAEFLRKPQPAAEAPLGPGARIAETGLSVGGALTGHHSIAGTLALANQVLRGRARPTVTERLVLDALGRRSSPTAGVLRGVGAPIPPPISWSWPGPLAAQQPQPQQPQPFPNAFLNFVRP